MPAELAQQSKIGEQFKRGLLVTDINVGGPSYHKLSEERDIIVEILNPSPRRPVTSQGDLEKALGSVKKGQYVTLLVYNLDVQSTRVESFQIQ